MKCQADALLGAEARAALQNSAPHYVGEDRTIREAALDQFQKHLDDEHANRPVGAIVFQRVPLAVEVENTIKITALTCDGPGRFRLDDASERAEGSGLEQSVHQLLDNTFGERLYRSPQVGGGAKRRELTDILGICDRATMLIEAKVETMFAGEHERTAERRTSSMIKAINKAQDQLLGAVRRLRSGETVYRANGQSIRIEPDEIKSIHCIILISDMYPTIDWQAIAKNAIQLCQDQNVVMHVFDLTELRMIVGAAERADILHANLIGRLLAVAKGGSAFVRSRFPREPRVTPSADPEK